MQRLNTIIIFIVLHIVLCTIIDPLRYIGLTLGRCPYASFSLFCATLEYQQLSFEHLSFGHLEQT